MTMDLRTRHALEHTRHAAERLGELAAEASGGEIVAIDNYEITLADLPMQIVRPAQLVSAEH
jgi:hypothetical protein